MKRKQQVINNLHSALKHITAATDTLNKSVKQGVERTRLNYYIERLKYYQCQIIIVRREIDVTEKETP